MIGTVRHHVILSLYTTSHFLFTDMLRIITYFDQKKKIKIFRQTSISFCTLMTLEECDGVECGRKFPEGGNMCILMADAC